MRTKHIVVAIAILVALGRIFITPIIPLTWTDAYIANAHLFAGFLIGVRFYDWKGQLGPTRLYWWLGWSLAFWELGFYLVQKHLLAAGI